MIQKPKDDEPMFSADAPEPYFWSGIDNNSVTGADKTKWLDNDKNIRSAADYYHGLASPLHIAV